MKLKLIVALVQNEHTDAILEAARNAGATGSTVIERVRGEGLTPEKSFLGLDVQSMCTAVLFVVAEARAHNILEKIAKAGQFEEKHGTGLAFQVAIEDAIGLSSQLPTLTQEEEERI